MIRLAGNIIVEDGKLLLLDRGKHWEVPGGKVEEGESPVEAAAREASEEIGVEVEVERPFYTGEFQHDGKIFEWNGYISRIEKGEPEVKEGKFNEVRWFTAEELENVELAPNLRMIEGGLKRLLR